MPEDPLTAAEAARCLGISVTTLYDWLGQSDYGLLRIRGTAVTIEYLQGGPLGQGKIGISAEEVDRLKHCMRVVPQRFVPRRPKTRSASYPGITVPLGRPTT